jgi:hypothetical protein
MGNAFSKANRKLPKQGNVISAVKLKGKEPQPLTNQLWVQSSKTGIGRDGFDPDFDSKLRQLGAAELREIPQTFAKTNHMLQAVEARNNLDKQMEHELKDHSVKRTQLHPSTLFALLQSRKDGDSDGDLAEHYNLDPAFLSRLGTRASVPDRPTAKRLREIQIEREAEMIKTSQR